MQIAAPSSASTSIEQTILNYYGVLLHYRWVAGCRSYVPDAMLTSSLLPIEHMEADDNTPKALPEWVELEYKVRGVDALHVQPE